MLNVLNAMPFHRQFYEKSVFIFLAIFFTFGFIVIVLDQHFAGYSPTCLICEAKSSINGSGSFFVLELDPVIIKFVLNEYPLNFTIPVISIFQNKSPPKSLYD
jgi:hypothetical protein